LREGTYFLDAPLTISSNLSSDSSANFQLTRYPGEHPVISAARLIPLWVRHNPGNSPEIWRAPYPDSSINLTNPLHNLWIGGQWAIKSRYPKNSGLFSHPEWQNQNFWLYADRTNIVGSTGAPAQDGISRMPIAAADWPVVANWAYGGMAELSSHDAYGYTVATYLISAVDTANQDFQFTNPYSNFIVNPGTRYFVSNIFEQLTDPGEWYLDKNNRLIYYVASPGANPNSSSAAISALRNIVSISGNSPSVPVKNIILDGLTFSGTAAQMGTGNPYNDDGALHISNASNITVRNCLFENLSGSAILADHDSSAVTASRNVFSALGSAGIISYGHPYYGAPPSQIQVLENFVIRTGLVRNLPSILFFGASNSAALRNQIDRVTGIAIGFYSMPADGIASQNNIVSGNEITNAVLGTADLGAIYFAGNTVTNDEVPMTTSVTGNRILHTRGAVGRSDGILLAPHGANGIFLDNFASQITISGNIVSDASHSILKISGGRHNQISQNVFGNYEGAVDDASAIIAPFSFFLANSDAKVSSLNHFFQNTLAFTGSDTSLRFWNFTDFLSPTKAFTVINNNTYFRSANANFGAALSFFRYYAPSATFENHSYADWQSTIGADASSTIAFQTPGYALDADGKTILAGNGTRGPALTMQTGLRAITGSSNLASCLSPKLGPQLAPANEIDPKLVFACFAP
jgi:hypothetical protein